MLYNIILYIIYILPYTQSFVCVFIRTSYKATCHVISRPLHDIKGKLQFKFIMFGCIEISFLGC